VYFILVQDPLTLEVVAEVVSAERFSYARMAMVALQNSEGEDEDAIILLGDEVLLTYIFYHFLRKNLIPILNIVIIIRMSISIVGIPAPKKSS
jgi:hypothetical protein